MVTFSESYATLCSLPIGTTTLLQNKPYGAANETKFITKSNYRLIILHRILAKKDVVELTIKFVTEIMLTHFYSTSSICEI